MIMQIIVAQEPVLPNNVVKHLFESNKQYRVYFLQQKEDEGTAKYFTIKITMGNWPVFIMRNF